MHAWGSHLVLFRFTLLIWGQLDASSPLYKLLVCNQRIYDLDPYTSDRREGLHISASFFEKEGFTFWSLHSRIHKNGGLACYPVLPDEATPPTISDKHQSNPP
jgi:hypothetical protein